MAASSDTSGVDHQFEIPGERLEGTRSDAPDIADAVAPEHLGGLIDKEIDIELRQEEFIIAAAQGHRRWPDGHLTEGPFGAILRRERRQRIDGADLGLQTGNIQADPRECMYDKAHRLFPQLKQLS